MLLLYELVKTLFQLLKFFNRMLIHQLFLIICVVPVYTQILPVYTQILPVYTCHNI